MFASCATNTKNVMFGYKKATLVVFAKKATNTTRAWPKGW